MRAMTPLCPRCAEERQMRLQAERDLRDVIEALEMMIKRHVLKDSN